MDFNRVLRVSKLAVLSVVLMFFVVGSSRADQSLWQGKFTLPYAVKWGDALLPAGEYTFRISIPETGGPISREDLVRASEYKYRIALADTPAATSARVTLWGEKKAVTVFPWRVTPCSTREDAIVTASLADGERIVNALHIGDEIFYFGTPEVQQELIAAGYARGTKSGIAACCLDGAGSSSHVHTAMVEQIRLVTSGT